MEHFNDEELCGILQADLFDDSFVLIMLGKYTINLYIHNDGGEYYWKFLGHGDLGGTLLSVIRNLSRARRVKYIEFENDHTLDQYAHSELTNYVHLAVRLLTLKELDDWINISQKLTFGRKGEVSSQTKFRVATSAAYRCQFEGCGLDLANNLLSSGNYAYYAHIIASSPEGPRGDPILSRKLADSADNILLLCDKCHRLIDRVCPKVFTVEFLKEMRAKSIARVGELLSTLSYKKADIVAITGNIAGQLPDFNLIDAQKAMWENNICKSEKQPIMFARNARHLENVCSPTYWGEMFHILKGDKLMLDRTLQDASYLNSSEPLAIFPLHSTSVLILSGRIIGDSRTLYLFQYHRNNPEGLKWHWPSVSKPQKNKFSIIVFEKKDVTKSEGALLVYLTAFVPYEDLPEHIYDSNFKLPTVQISIEDCSIEAINHPKDLEILGKVLDEAISILQDKWGINLIHLFVIAPSSACFKVGQKMQARHHANFVLYERDPNREKSGRKEFSQTIIITSTIARFDSSGATLTEHSLEI